MKYLLLLAVCAFVFASPALGQQRTSKDHFMEANVWYVMGEYKKAIKPYQKALDLEKQERKLERQFWIVLVDNLGMSYGITGDIKRSMAVFEYGIKEEPTYPLFYYNMACGYGELGDEDNAIKNLRLAFKYKANMPKTNASVGPETDTSFAKFRKSKKFDAAISEMTGLPTTQRTTFERESVASIPRLR